MKTQVTKVVPVNFYEEKTVVCKMNFDAFGTLIDNEFDDERVVVRLSNGMTLSESVDITQEMINPFYNAA